MQIISKRKQIEEFNSVDGPYYLVRTVAGIRLAITWCPEKARLIAAAPELLDALRRVLAESMRDTPAYRAASEALAKAEGK